MKKTKKMLIGFILLWVLAFLVMWGVSLIKKTQFAGKEADQAQKAPPVQGDESVPVRCFRMALTDLKDELAVMGTIKGGV